MPAKDGDWTPQERIFAKEMARTSDPVYAAEKAGYRHPAVAASKLQRRAPVMADVRRRQVERLNGTMVPLAYDHLERVLRDESAPIRAKNDAAKIVLTQAKGLDEGGHAKDLSEMSASELNAFIAASKARIAELEGEANTIEHEAAPEPEPEPPPQPALAEGIFE